MAITKIGTPELFDFSATNTALQLPTGDTASRPSAPSAGEWRFNSELKYVEYWDGGSPGEWRQIDTEAPANPDDFPSQNFNVNTYFGNGGTQTIDAKFNEAANFNGSSSKIDIASTITGNNSFSVSFWLNPTANNITPFMMGSASTGQAFLTFVTGNTLNFGRGGDSLGSTTSNTIPNNTWTHIAVSSNAGSVTVYVNGVSNLTFSTTYNISSGGTFIGYASGYSQYFKGKIDQVRIFNTAITAAQAEDLYTDETTTTAATLDFPVGAGCFAAYQLDGDASDISGTYGGVTTDIGYTGLRFQPDFVWIKNRQPGGVGYSHQLYDSIRGVNEVIFSNDTDQQYTRTQGLQSFNTNGFTVGSRADTNSGNMVAWCWYAPTAESISASGSQIASTVKKNVDAGFSIVQGSFATNEASTKVVGHGLTSPKLIIYKATNIVLPWFNFGVHGGSVFGNNNVLRFNTDAAANDSTFDITGTTFKVGSTNTAHTFIAYCFENVAGYQKIGSYVGTNAPGNIISTELTVGDGGFEPALVMIKSTGATNGNWIVFDNKRNSVNPRTDVLKWDTNGAETTEAALDVTFATNGFVLNGAAGAGGTGQINSSGITYLYLAIAADKDTSVPTQANSFSPTIYTGNGGTQNIYTPFAPDFTWIKGRTGAAESHVWNDTIRGISNAINSNTTGGQYFGSGFYNTSFNPNGFTVGDNPAGNYGVNGNAAPGIDYVSWNWKAGGLPTINNDGSITSIVSANQNAGFSIVKYTGNGTAGATVGHGLTSLTPSLIIWKNTSATSNWLVYSPLIGNDSQFLYLNLTNEAQTSGNQNEYPTNKVNPTSTLVTVNGAGSSNNINISGENTIMYCFADIAGYQKVGSYTGNLTTPPSITTGFSPRFLMIKKIDNGTGPWVLIDSARASTNPASARLRANTSDTEYSNSAEAIYRSVTGFTVGTAGNLNTWDGMNANSTNYLYLAIA